MVNGPSRIYVERGGRLHLTGTTFSSEAHLRTVIERIVSRIGRRIDESSPLVDARLQDGSRVNAVIPPLAVDGPSLTIRKFAAVPLTVHDLIRFDSISPDMAQLLDACVRARLNVIVSGGTGTGKTTLLNVLSSFIPADERIVTIEDAVELQLQQEHVVRLGKPSGKYRGPRCRWHPGARPELSPDAARQDRRRRSARRRSPGHAPGHEHGPRWFHLHGSFKLAQGCHCPNGNPGPDGGNGSSVASHP